jgi:hypothetical protein
VCGLSYQKGPPAGARYRRAAMTRTAFRDLSNTPQRGLPIRQQKPGLQPCKSHQQPPPGAAWCNAIAFSSREGQLANQSPARGAGAVQLQPSRCSAGATSKDPLSLLAPLERSPAATPWGQELVRQQQQFNGALVRDFRRISAATASLAPASPAASSLNATQSALESCIRELDGIMPNLSTSDASLVEKSATASPLERSASFSSSHPEWIALLQASPAVGGSFAAEAHARGAVIPSPDPPTAISAEAEQGRRIGKSLPIAAIEDLGASPCSDSVDAQPSLARKSDGHLAAWQRSSSQSASPATSAAQDTDRAVATLGNAMQRLQKELSLLGQELKARPSDCSPASSCALEGAQLASSVSLVVWPGSPCQTPRRHSPAGGAATSEHDSWRILSPGDATAGRRATSGLFLPRL